jgi:hypothetical protein
VNGYTYIASVLGKKYAQYGQINNWQEEVEVCKPLVFLHEEIRSEKSYGDLMLKIIKPITAVEEEHDYRQLGRRGKYFKRAHGAFGVAAPRRDR